MTQRESAIDQLNFHKCDPFSIHHLIFNFVSGDHRHDASTRDVDCYVGWNRAEFTAQNNCVFAQNSSTLFSMDNSSNPATQADIQSLREDLMNWKTQLHEEMQAHRDEVMHHFDLVFEQYAAAMRGAAKDEFQMLKDQQSDHGRRITRLESHSQLVS